MPAELLDRVASVSPVLDPLTEAVSDVIDEHRDRLGLSVYALIKTTGMSRAKAYRVSNRTHGMNVEELGLIAAALGTTASALLAEAEGRLDTATEG